MYTSLIKVQPCCIYVYCGIENSDVIKPQVQDKEDRCSFLTDLHSELSLNVVY